MRRSTAMIFVNASASTTDRATPKKSRGFGLLFSIFFALLARNAKPRVRQRVEPVEPDLTATLMAAAERFGRTVEAAQRFVDVPEETSLLAREQERLLAFHRVGALIRHVERVRREIAVGALRCGTERLVIVAEFLQHALPFFEQ